MTVTKSMFLVGLLPLAFAGCTSPNPKIAFDDVDRHIVSRSGQELRWMRDEAAQKEIEQAVEELLQTNLTAQTAVSVALLNNRALQAEFEEIGITQADLAQASRLRNPVYAGLFRLPTHGPTVLNAENSVSQDLLDLLTLPARKKIAARNLEQTQLRVAHEVLRLTSEVQGGFYTLQAREQFVKRVNIIVEAQARADRERLNRLLGLWGKQTNWKIADELPSLPGKELPLENLEAIAVNRRFDLAAARSEVRAVASALRLKKNFRYLPGVAIGVNAEHDLDHSWVVGPTLDLELPLFDQGQPAIARLAAQYRRAKRNFEALAVNIRSEVRENRDALIAARDAAEYYQKVLLPQRQRVLRETLLQYNAMQKSNYDLLAAKEREQVAERGYVEALRDYWIARGELERAVGSRLPEEAPVAPTAKRDSKEHRH